MIHDLVVDGVGLELVEKKYDVTIPADLLLIPDVQERRLHIMKIIKKVASRVGLQHLEAIQRIQHLGRIYRLEHLERLHKLNIDSTKHNKLTISNKSYEEVEIVTPTDETIIYLDPPYTNTHEYQKRLDYEQFYKWVESSKYKIYISSYESPFYEVASWSKRVTISATGNNQRADEKLFCNQKESKKQKELF